MKTFRAASIVVALATSLGTAGCSLGVDPTEESPTTLPEGLSVLESSDTSLNVAFREKNTVVFMQAKLGRMTPEIYQKDSKSPKYEIDARFMDANGFIFYIQQAGDDWIDPTWGKDLERQMKMERPLSGSNEVLFRLATEAASALRTDLTTKIGNDAVAKLSPVVDSIVASASRMHSQYREEFKIREQALLAQGLPAMPHLDGAAKEITYGTPGPDDPYWTYSTGTYYSISLHADRLDGIPGYAGGYHSATRRSAWSGGAIYWAHDTCNHGACAGTMTKRSGSPDGGKWFGPDELKAYHCSGEYKWDSDGGNYGHNCHDDSRIQMHNFAYKSQVWGTFRWCDGGDRDHDISVDVFGVELDQEGYPEYSTSTNRGYGAQ